MMKKNGKISGIVLTIISVIVAAIVYVVTMKKYVALDDVVASFKWLSLVVIACVVMMVCGQFMYNVPSQIRNKRFELIGIIISSIVELFLILESGAYLATKYGLGAIIGTILFTMLFAVILWGIAEMVSRARIRHIKRVLAA